MPMDLSDKMFWITRCIMTINFVKIVVIFWNRSRRQSYGDSWSIAEKFDVFRNQNSPWHNPCSPYSTEFLECSPDLPEHVGSWRLKPVKQSCMVELGIFRKSGSVEGCGTRSHLIGLLGSNQVGLPSWGTDLGWVKSLVALPKMIV